MKAIVFDMDGVITDTEIKCIEAFNETAKAFNINVSKDNGLENGYLVQEQDT